MHKGGAAVQADATTARQAPEEFRHTILGDAGDREIHGLAVKMLRAARTADPAIVLPAPAAGYNMQRPAEVVLHLDHEPHQSGFQAIHLPVGRRRCDPDTADQAGPRHGDLWLGGDDRNILRPRLWKRDGAQTGGGAKCLWRATAQVHGRPLWINFQCHGCVMRHAHRDNGNQCTGELTRTLGYKRRNNSHNKPIVRTFNGLHQAIAVPVRSCPDLKLSIGSSFAD